VRLALRKSFGPAIKHAAATTWIWTEFKQKKNCTIFSATTCTHTGKPHLANDNEIPCECEFCALSNGNWTRSTGIFRKCKNCIFILQKPGNQGFNSSHVIVCTCVIFQTVVIANWTYYPWCVPVMRSLSRAHKHMTTCTCTQVTLHTSAIIRRVASRSISLSLAALSQFSLLATRSDLPTLD